VYLSARYIADRFLPDKAIDLLDEAGSRARINAFKRRKERQVAILSESPSSYWQEIRNVQAAQEAVSSILVGFLRYFSGQLHHNAETESRGYSAVLILSFVGLDRH
jgi:ATP-dependent Clp protease ATP-binding subunit ClpA